MEHIKKMAFGIRRRVLEYTLNHNGGYLSQACSSAEILASLYGDIMHLDRPKSPLMPGPFPGLPGKECEDLTIGSRFNGKNGPEFDRFFLSPAQYALVLYAALIEASHMAPEGLLEFNKDGSSVEMIGALHSPGMEAMTGSLGQGISQAAGVALARKLKGESGRSVVFLSDGECQSGQMWEAVQMMAHYELDNMLLYIDMNGQQCDGKVVDVMKMGSMAARLEAFGARVFSVDGHNIEKLCELGHLKGDGRPTFVLAETVPYQGIPLLQKKSPKYHYVRFSSQEEKELFQNHLKVMEEEGKKSWK